MGQITVENFLFLPTGIILSYLLGAIPFAYLFGRVYKGIDIRQFGSGNIGATNAFRVLGKIPGSLVLIFDICKGFLSITLIGNLLLKKHLSFSADLTHIVLGISCIAGHNWTIFLKFKGGKGVATSLGVLIGLSLVTPQLWRVFLLTLLIWLSVFLFSHMVSLASLVSSLAFTILTVYFRFSKELVLMSIVLCIFSFLRHQSNILRILQGKEPRVNFKK